MNSYRFGCYRYSIFIFAFNGELDNFCFDLMVLGNSPCFHTDALLGIIAFSHVSCFYANKGKAAVAGPSTDSKRRVPQK